MCLLIETIKVIDGQLQNLHYHNARLNRSRKELFGCTDIVDLVQHIKVPTNADKGIQRCTVTYSKAIHDVKFVLYHIKAIEKIKLVMADDIDYDYKYADRSKLNELLNKKNDCDEILIIKENKVTDTTYTNVLFYNGDKWLTPSQPLLRGTKRQKLLDEGKIEEADIRVEDLKDFQKIGLINAMLDIGDILLSCKQIF